MSTNRTFDEILKAVEHHHDLYIKNLRLLHEAAPTPPGRPAAVRAEKPGNSPANSPALRAIAFSSDLAARDTPHSQSPTTQRIRRLSGLTSDGSDPGHPSGFALADKRGRHPSLDDAAMTNSDDGDDMTIGGLSRALTMGRPMPDSYATKPVASQSFLLDDLKRHLALCSKAPKTTIAALGEIWDDGEEIDATDIIERFENYENDYTDAVYEVFDVG
jgi:hypothetical protein